MGVPFAVALGLLVAILDLIPLAGATIAGIVVVAVSFIHSIPAGIVAARLHRSSTSRLENHFLQPLIYGRTVQLSPLVVLISILIGAELAGILGALAAIPVAGSLQVVIRDILAVRRARATRAWRCRPEQPPTRRGRTPAHSTTCGAPKDPLSVGSSPAQWPTTCMWDAATALLACCAALLVAALAPAPRSHSADGSRTTRDRPRVGRPRRAERHPQRATACAAQAQPRPLRRGPPAHVRDARRRLLRARVRRRPAVLGPDRAVLSRGARAVVGRREPALGVAELGAATAVELWMGSPGHRGTSSRRAGARSASPRWTRAPRPASSAAAPSRSSPTDFGVRVAPQPSAATLRARARSSVEERRPSKPLVGGSNPPGRITPRSHARLRATLCLAVSRSASRPHRAGKTVQRRGVLGLLISGHVPADARGHPTCPGSCPAVARRSQSIAVPASLGRTAADPTRPLLCTRVGRMEGDPAASGRPPCGPRRRASGAAPHRVGRPCAPPLIVHLAQVTCRRRARGGSTCAPLRSDRRRISAAAGDRAPATPWRRLAGRLRRRSARRQVATVGPTSSSRLAKRGPVRFVSPDGTGEASPVGRSSTWACLETAQASGSQRRQAPHERCAAVGRVPRSRHVGLVRRGSGRTISV